MATRRALSTPQKNRDASSTMIATMTEVIQVSLRLVQVILRASARTSRANCAGLVFLLGASDWATAAGEAIAAAVLAARFLIACGGRAPDFLAMAASLNSLVGPLKAPAPMLTVLLI